MILQKWEDVIAKAKNYRGDIHGRDMDLQRAFSQLLRESMEEYGLTQSALARGIKRGFVAVHHWFHGNTCPTYKTMIEIRDYLEVLKIKNKIERKINDLENKRNCA